MYCRFVLYQMSKNMNKRLFFVFLSNLSKVPRKQILQVTFQNNNLIKFS